MEAHITLYGQHARRFEELKEQLEEERGLELSNAAAVRELMVRADIDWR
jgi:hypothetical protein